MSRSTPREIKPSRSQIRARLVCVCGVELSKKPPRQDIGTAVEEWLDGNKGAGRVFDEQEFDFRRFVLDVQRVIERHRPREGGCP